MFRTAKTLGSDQFPDRGDGLDVVVATPGHHLGSILTWCTLKRRLESEEENKKGKTIYSERCAKQILRIVDLPAHVDGTKVSTTLEDGILNIELAKATATYGAAVDVGKTYNSSA